MTGRRGRALLIAALVALTAPAAAAHAATQPPETVAARQHFFGAANVDGATGAVRRDRLLLSWFGVAGFAMAIDGHVVLLDAWVPRGEHSGYVPTSPDELAALKPEYIFLGHGHFDHAADAATVIAKSGARLVGTPEHCDQVRSQAGAGALVGCVEAVPRGAKPGVQRALDGLLPGIGITVMKHVHSATRGPDSKDGFHVPVTPPPSPQTVAEHPPTPQDFAHFIGHAGDAEGGTLFWEFRVRKFRLVYHDSVGPLREDAPEVLDLLRGFAHPDLQISSIQGFNQFANAMRDVRDYADAVRPKLFVPAHHDDWAPGVTTRGERYQPYLQQELAKLPPDDRPSVRFLFDPYDYLRPELLTFETGAPSPAPVAAPCASRRTFAIRLPVVSRGRLVSARVYVNGKRVRVLRGGRLRALVNLRGRPRGRFLVVVVGRTSTGRIVVQTRRYRTCAPRPR